MAFVPGNHDEVFREYDGMVFGNVEIRSEVIHQTRDGRRLLVMHGDEFASVVQASSWVAKLGGHAYDALLYANRWVNKGRRRFGLGYWPLAAYLKYKVKNAVSYISNFEEVVAREAALRDVDGIVCGHIHHAEIRRIGEVEYYNCGDWVESQTALVEHHNGRSELVRWTERQAEVEATGAAALARAG